MKGTSPPTKNVVKTNISDDLTMEWFSEVMDLREPVSVSTFGVSNQMFQVLPNRFFYEWKKAAVEGCYVLMGW